MRAQRTFGAKLLFDSCYFYYHILLLIMQLLFDSCYYRYP